MEMKIPSGAGTTHLNRWHGEYNLEEGEGSFWVGQYGEG